MNYLIDFILLCANVLLFLTFARCSSAPVGHFSRSRLRGTQGARLYTTAQDWIPCGLRGACSERSKKRNLASNPEVAFRGARAEQDNGNSTCQLLCCTGENSLYVVAATVQQQSHIKVLWTTANGASGGLAATRCISIHLTRKQQQQCSYHVALGIMYI